MTYAYIITKVGEHPLDAIWADAIDEYGNAYIEARDATPATSTTAEARLHTAVAVLVALPARDLEDASIKLDAISIDNDIREGFDLQAVINELNDHINVSMALGKQQRPADPKGWDIRRETAA